MNWVIRRNLHQCDNTNKCFLIQNRKKELFNRHFIFFITVTNSQTLT
ncbi:hypothetical protein HanXRQr2_Chr06g0238901 [Helianthus annuus]|uniref:Uncharacterized protein n=1 Tax=Helianthus annuus TaxID=4232 RepID=A0A9K3IQ33_HELAN|nr:hypothetical protein HanXRQr2_Chr06g0238901 [Helianthus annuus]KAJ0739378.1 hypothetical protein HanOQP8_Chr06g0205201 [Helianthus annuus]